MSISKSTGFSLEEVLSELKCHPVIGKLLLARGFNTPDQLEMLFQLDLAKLPSPWNLIDMKKAVDRVVGAILNRETILIYGDYDVDGTCGASILIDFLNQIGVPNRCYQPNRFTEGYGVHTKAMEQFADEGVNVVVTVDCGITAHEPCQYARTRGLDVIILDHHKTESTLPSAYAVVNPQREDDTSGLKNLCGAGIAFFFIVGLRAALRDTGFFGEKSPPNLLKFLDLVAIATVADVVNVLGVNRILLHHGLKVLKQTSRPGLRAMMELAKIQEPTTMHCGFVFGPRINAAGRLQSARYAFDLLTSRDEEVAKNLAIELEKFNEERRKKQDEVVSAARASALRQLDDENLNKLKTILPAALAGPWPRALVLAPNLGSEENWHEGVVGIVATKIMEEFRRPVFVLAKHQSSSNAEVILKGSIRSLPGIDIIQAVSAESVACHLSNFGGHAHAGGLSLKQESLRPFIEALNTHLALTHDENSYRKKIRYDLTLSIQEIDERLMTEIDLLGPYGQGFLEPAFLLDRPRLHDYKVLKEKHLKLRFKKGFSNIEALWFNSLTNGLEPVLQSLDAGGSLLVSPQWNEWQGSKKLQLKVQDLVTSQTV